MKNTFALGALIFGFAAVSPHFSLSAGTMALAEPIPH